MSKRDFDCSSYDSSLSDTEGAYDDDSNSVESDSEEDEPSIPSTSPLMIEIAKNCIDCFRVFCICETFVGVVRFVMLAFGSFPIKEVALQVRESDSRILIRLYSYPCSGMCIYLSLLLFYQFLGVFTFHDSAKSRCVHSLWLSSFLPMFRCST